MLTPGMRKNIIITGAGRGIGAACTAAFLKAGYQVGLIGRNSERLAQTANGHATVDETDIDTWLNVVRTNLTGSFLCARAAFAIMRAQSPQGGRIINNGSISAHTPRPGSAPYTATKHAITGLTKSLSLDGRAHNIVCGQIDIGNALTEMTEQMRQGVPQPDGSTKAEATMDVAHIASSVLYMAELPLDANVQFMTVMAPKMPFIGRG